MSGYKRNGGTDGNSEGTRCIDVSLQISVGHQRAWQAGAIIQVEVNVEVTGRATGGGVAVEVNALDVHLVDVPTGPRHNEVICQLVVVSVVGRLEVLRNGTVCTRIVKLVVQYDGRVCGTTFYHLARGSDLLRYLWP